jgi:hypothetical protein
MQQIFKILDEGQDWCSALKADLHSPDVGYKRPFSLPGSVAGNPQYVQ